MRCPRDDWRVIEELDVLSAVTRQYTWGRDLSGSLEGAGGIGGLLAMKDLAADPDEEFIYAADAMGNVGQLVALADDYGSATGSAWDDSRMVARYEYDPYGNVVGPDSDTDGTPDAFDDDTPYAAANAYRFSTKPQDAETGLSYFGYRYYNARLGRWINRDPIGELGGNNLFRYAENRAIAQYDALGLCPADAGCTPGEGRFGLTVQYSSSAVTPPGGVDELLNVVYVSDFVYSYFLQPTRFARGNCIVADPSATERRMLESAISLADALNQAKPTPGDIYRAIEGLVESRRDNNEGALWFSYSCDKCVKRARQERTWGEWWYCYPKKWCVWTEWKRTKTIEWTNCDKVWNELIPPGIWMLDGVTDEQLAILTERCYEKVAQQIVEECDGRFD